MNAIEIENLVKRFDDFVAVDHLNLSIRQGELISLLGPNGAGKSTTIRILTTLLPPSEGTITIAGHRVPEGNERIKPLLGLVPQEIALYDTLSARRNLNFFAGLYGLQGAARDSRVNELLDSVELSDRADDRVTNFSGGMQRRVNIAAALVHDPEIIFMDEPTVGLDPVSRSAIWSVIEKLKQRGKTILLTTHYMEEAEALCDRVAIVDHGKTIAVGTPAELIEETGIQTVLNISVVGPAETCLDEIRALEGVEQVVVDEDSLRIYTSAGSRLLPQVIQALMTGGADVRAAEVTEPNLGAVYLHYTGRELRD